AERFAFRALALLLLRQAVALRRQLLETCLLDLGGTLGVRDVAGNLLPALPPFLHRGLGLLKRRLGLVSRRVRLFEPGAELLERELELLQLELVVRDVRANFLELRLGRLEILALPLHQLSPVLDRLL